jgi:agmatinase
MESKIEKTNNFNPNDVGNIHNNIFGLPFNSTEAEIVLIPVPWDVTTSSKSGTSKAPKGIFEASLQVDLYDPFCKDLWKAGIYMEKPSEYWKHKNKKLRKLSEKHIKLLSGKSNNTNDFEFSDITNTINTESAALNKWVKDQSLFFIDKKKSVAIIGGEHSAPLGLIQALAEKHNDFGILQIDAHADLRNAYEGFQFSHASIMFNALKIPQITRLVQIGIRDYCEEENNMIENDERIITFFDGNIHQDLFQGKNWTDISVEIVSKLPQKVYISFDIDGLKPANCPGTGTPVPGGLDFNQVLFLFAKLVEVGKTIIGFDICEVADSGRTKWDYNVAARLLYKMSGVLLKSTENRK